MLFSAWFFLLFWQYFYIAYFPFIFVCSSFFTRSNSACHLRRYRALKSSRGSLRHVIAPPFPWNKLASLLSRQFPKGGFQVSDTSFSKLREIFHWFAFSMPVTFLSSHLPGVPKLIFILMLCLFSSKSLLQKKRGDRNPSTLLTHLLQSFKLNNKIYIWEAESKYHQNKHLYEIIETSKPAPAPATSETTAPAAENGAITTPTSTVKRAREIARYTQKHVHGHGHAGGKEGLLVIDTERIGALEGVLTLCAMLEVRDLPELWDFLWVCFSFV